MRSIFWQISQQRNEKIEDMKTTITGIRSGGQSGVDRAALDFARKYKMEVLEKVKELLEMVRTDT